MPYHLGMPMKTVSLWLVLPLASITMSVLVLGGCAEQTGTAGLANGTAGLAKVDVTGIGPRPYGHGPIDFLVRGQGYQNIQIGVRVEAANVTPNKPYFVALVAPNSYLFDVKTVAWSPADLASPDPSERDTRKIAATKERRLRNVTLSASPTDKVIEPLWRDFNDYWGKRRDQALKHGKVTIRILEGGSQYLNEFEPAEAEVQRIVLRHVKVIFTDQAGMDRRYGQSGARPP